MASRSLKTKFSLPPGAPSTSTIRELARRFFSDNRWFQPVRYGGFDMAERLEPGPFNPDVLAAYYDEFKNFTIGAKTDRDFLQITAERHGRYPYAGSFTWMTSVVEARKPGWREAHLRQVVEIMHLLGSPLVQAGLKDDFDRKTNRIVPNEDGFGSTLVFNVRDYSEGLDGLFWRNIFGAPFVKLFGARLDAIPPEQRQALDGGLVLVQPYELPTQAMTPDGDAAEARLIATLGPASFYDHQTNAMPLRVPDVSSLPRAS
ncbi:hypothetical protein D7Y13_28755 [Corallococcus praedator]|uniref:DUF3396 domain-containing protein n=1 Tax=Corallococcus praedator TaxID=2316724 RepID=A0ABX9QB38_9BACT|nr:MULTISPECIES: hypothetical protein [Corallococcus]RKH98415.1 hypothetical protein D7Y13_28755 [Corallococcus praedator]